MLLWADGSCCSVQGFVLSLFSATIWSFLLSQTYVWRNLFVCVWMSPCGAEESFSFMNDYEGKRATKRERENERVKMNYVNGNPLWAAVTKLYWMVPMTVQNVCVCICIFGEIWWKCLHRSEGSLHLWFELFCVSDFGSKPPLFAAERFNLMSELNTCLSLLTSCWHQFPHFSVFSAAVLHPSDTFRGYNACHSRQNSA